MKINSSISFLVLGIALIATHGLAQTTPTGTVNSTNKPQGAIAPDSMSPRESVRMQKRAMKRNRRAERANANGTTTNTSVQDARYRESSVSGGTSVNNSNTTNYNSNNVTNAPTGAGSNPNTKEALKKNTDPGNSQPNRQDSNAGTIRAVESAEMTKTPAVNAGSTVRNTSIGDFVASSPNYITLQNALQTSDLFDMLKGSTSYTLFAPTNNAFKKLPTAVQAGLLDGSNREALKQLLSYHVVDGALTNDELSRQIKAGNGKAQLKTVAGNTLTAQLSANGRITLTDEQGATTQVNGTSNLQANGVIYEVDTVLMPKERMPAFK